MIVQFSCSTSYSSLYGVVDGFNMDKLIRREQAAPTTTPSTTGSDTNLASIAISMLSISSKNTSWSADNGKEETIDHNNIPKDVGDQCSHKNDQSKIIAKSDLADFSNNLIVNTTGAQQQ